MSNKSSPSILSLTLMLAGNLIGSGLLALPICLGMAGLVPSLIGLVVVWLLMMFTAFVIAGRVAKRRDVDFDLPSFFANFLGQKVKWIAIAANAIVLYGLLVAYLAGASSILDANVFHHHIPFSAVLLLFFVCITAINIFGVNLVRRCNVLLMFVLFISFIYLVCATGVHISLHNFQHAHWLFLLVALPILVNSYNCHNVVPIVCRSLDFDLKRTRRAIFGGLTIGFFLNTVWSIVVIGAMHFAGLNGIFYAYQHNLPVTISLSSEIHSHLFTTIALIFGLVAIITSYITVGAALTCFVKDLRKNLISKAGRSFDLLVTFLPPLIITFLMPHIFLSAQGIIGGVGIAVLFGVLPSLVYVILSKHWSNRLFGLLASLFFFAIMLVVVLSDLGVTF